MLAFLKGLFCAHDFVFLRNLYGDQINDWSTTVLVRSVWRCSKCGKLQGRGELHDDGDLRGAIGPLPERGWD